MKKVLLLTVCLYSFVCLSQTTITRTLGDFDILKVYSGIDIKLIKSDKQELVITGEKSDKVKIKEKNKTLKIKLSFPETMADGKVKAVLYFNKDIAVIDVNEGVSISSEDQFIQNHIEIKAQEGAFADLDVDTKHLTVKASSGGIIRLRGKAKNQTVNVDLAATYHGYKLVVDNMSTIKAGSGAKAEVHSGETLNAKVSFGGTILYKGQPEVIDEKKVIGGAIEDRN
ncbi:head GIN domain-containing protein [Tenacibaculum sp. M341]|uniref:head GIN domain-containing protein n=1 Tax=Tenacibaculum sp. M341 TaxID=2530339 RepID=UPI001043473A|nr:head GIN domain-containing protein [Tenacibaculum sp. M341]TCI92111.1 DUF2807 domain-containing protein [Tenacibaculum sp. M341]